MSQPQQPITYESIEKWAINKLDKMIGFPSNEIVKYLLSMDTNADIENYLLNELLDTTAKSKSFSADLIKKLNSLPRKVAANKFQKVVVPPKINIKSNQTNNIKKKDKSNVGVKQHIGSFSDVKESIRHGEPCDCQATKHKLITNCLNCGKIICEQEGKGPCKFCNTALFVNPSSLSLQQQQINNEKLLSAIQYKDRILGYQNTSAKRTIVYDDQEDYFSNKNNKWISEEERKQVAQQELEYKTKLEEEKKKTRISFDFVGRRITAVPFDPNSVRVDSKLSFQSTSPQGKDITASFSESVIENKKDTSNFKYHTNQKTKSNISNNNSNSNNNNNNKDSNKKMVQDFSSIITKQYYGVDDDLIVLKSKEEEKNIHYKYKGIMEGLWCNFNTIVKRLPSKILYFKYLEMMKDKNCNYFVLCPENYYESSENDFLQKQIPKEVLTFLKFFNKESKNLGVIINIALKLPQSFVFGDEESLKLIKSRIQLLVKETDINEFTLILPSGFNNTFTAPICAPNSTKSEVNNAKTYSTTQTVFIQQLLDKNTFINNLIVVPSFFEMNLLHSPPSRQQIEYWLEISKSVPLKCPVLFTTLDGSLQNQTLQKVKSIFEKREIILIEKFPYKGGVSTKEHKVIWDPYQCYFTDKHSQLAGVLASPFDRESLLDNLTSVIAMGTFLQSLLTPLNYQYELSLRATLLELTSNEDIAEIFSNLILTLSNGLIDNIRLVLENNKNTDQEGLEQERKDSKQLDNRDRLILGEVEERSKKLFDYYKEISPNDSINQQFLFIIDTINKYLSL